MSHPKPVRIALLGIGRIAKKAYLPLLRAWPGVEIVSVCSRTSESAQLACAEWQIQHGTTEIQAMLDQKPEAVFVLSPTDLHAEHTRQLLNAGVDVFLEKPATQASPLIWDLTALAREKERVLMVGFNRRFSLLYRQARDILGDRPVQMCIAEKHRPSAYYVSLYNYYLDDIIHQIDLLRYFCGELEPLHTAFQMKDGRVAWTACSMQREDGGAALLQTSLAAGTWQERITLHGDGMTIEVDAFRELRVKVGNKVEVYGQDRPGRWVSAMEERGFTGQVCEFFDCLETRQQPSADGANAARSQELVEKIVSGAGESTTLIPFDQPYA
jgi:virulence factor